MADIVEHHGIENKILVIRGHRVMLDRDIAQLYGVKTGVLNQAVKRNIERFPEDFMFQLTRQEFENLKSQFVISSWGGVRKMPYAFTDYGVAMLSGVLNSGRAIRVNILIMRAFIRMRRLVLEHDELRKIIENIEKRLDIHDRQIAVAFAALKSILQPPAQITKKEYSPDGKKRMGFGKHKNGD